MKKILVVASIVTALLVVTLGASAQMNEAWIPALGSFVVPGLGQLLNDQIDQAIIHFGVSVAIWTAGFYSATLFTPMALVTPALALGWHAYSGYNAYTVAQDQGFTIGLIPGGIAFAGSF